MSNPILQTINNIFGFDDVTQMPNGLGENIQLVADVNPLAYPYANIVRSGTVSATQTPTTLYTTSLIKEFYLTGMSLSFAETYTSDGTFEIVGTVGGVNVVLCSMGYGGSVPGREIYVQVVPPILIDKGTNIQMKDVWDTTGYVINGVGNIFGFTYDSTTYNIR